MRIAINGAGIADPTLAYWLREARHDVLLIEEAPALRTGGYVIDFWGLGYDIAKRMGVLVAHVPSMSPHTLGAPLRRHHNEDDYTCVLEGTWSIVDLGRNRCLWCASPCQ
jgi:2-polyprenyl-6-methoxyphenol hydroxylase-like FAD-dependent oxidoreductase